ncbi:MAG TPA: DUF4124 domain-containing protein [Gammaproteobacteria bacterium]
MTRALPALALLMLLPALPMETATAADVFKCVTENGVVRYSATPCQDGDVEKLDIENDPTDVAAVRERMENRAEKVAAIEEAATKAAEAEREAEKKAEERAEQCTTARERLTKMMMERRMYRENEGQREYLTSEEMVKRRQEMRDKVAELCGD